MTNGKELSRIIGMGKERKNEDDDGKGSGSKGEMKQLWWEVARKNLRKRGTRARFLLLPT